MRHRLASVIVAVFLVGACAADGSVDGPAVDVATRITEVRALRVGLAQPAVELGRAGTQVEQDVRTLRTRPRADPSAQLAAVASARAEGLADLRAALAASGGVAVDGDGPDAVAAVAAWTRSRTFAEQLYAAADAELERIGLLATADLDLIDAIDGWDAPGSRSQQLDAFAAAADLAATRAADLAALEPHAACLGDLDRRVDAATFVAEATRELRRYVANHQGNTFDTRRAELERDPFGLGAPLAEVTAADCWDSGSPTGQASTALRMALGELEAALNPPDLEAAGDA